MKYEEVAINDVKQNPKNVRLHNDDNINLIKKSLQLFTQYKPLVVQKSTSLVLTGNGTYQAMKELGWEKVNVNFVDIDDQQADALAIVDNKSAELSQWNFANLSDAINIMPEDMLCDIKFDDNLMYKIKNMNKEFEPTEKQKKTLIEKPEKENTFNAEEHFINCPNCNKKFKL